MRPPKRLLPYAVLIAVAVLLAVKESALLYTLQDQNLFLHTPLFFKQQMVTAGGLLTWAGSYLTQFFYYPMLGAGVLCLLWAFLMWLLKRTFRLDSLWLTLVPVVCLLLTIVTLGYWVYYLKLPGHAFVATLGTIVAVALAWLYRSLPRRYFLRSLFVPLSACIGYPLFGFYGLLATALMALTAWRTDGSRRMTDTLTALLAIIAVPLVCYHTLYHETNIVNIYWTALPVFAMHGERYFAYNLPYVFLVGSILVAALIGKTKIMGYVWLQTTVMAVCVIAVALFWYKDDNFHRELSMRRSLESLDYGQMLATSQAVKGEPTRAICLMQNLALFRTGRMEQDMFHSPNGNARPNAPFSVRLVHTIGKMLYLQYGIPNYCYRWCMEDGVEYGWTVERLKLMAKCSLLNGEFVAAQRYLNLLKKTDFHRSWALQQENLIHRPQLITQDPELKAIIPLLRSDNFLTADQSQLEMFLIEQILSTPGTNVAQQDLARLTMRYYQRIRFKPIER